MNSYIIYDIWHGLSLAFKNFFSVLFLVIFLFVGYIAIHSSFDLYLSLVFIDEQFTIIKYAALTIVSLLIIQGFFIYFANKSYIIDCETGSITFPRSDVENKFWEILLLVSYWNLMRTRTINASEIENLYIDTKRWTTTSRVYSGSTSKGKARYRTQTNRHVLYTINIAGTFGSANLSFSSRQKRDETRNAIQQCVKQHSSINIDRKVAEFS